jgi:hypothetical protein
MNMPMKSFFRRLPVTATLLLSAALASPPAAQAQIFWQPPDVTSPPMTGAEPESGVNLPGATPAELNAGLLWNLRAALNVAALQCDFEPTLLTTSNYNAMLAQHRAELASAFKTVNDYFLRIGGPKIGQKQFDQYGTRTYSAFSTVQAQHNFCQTAGSVGRDAIFAPRGTLYRVAQNRMGALRKALVVQRDQAYGTPSYGFVASVPSFEKKCWKRDTLTKKCAQAWLQSQGK